MDPQNPGIKAGDRIAGYQVEKITELPEIQSFFYELTHPGTGARHIHISCQDTENTFSVAFKTVPRDSTGVAHILEHTVLCGSRKYPVRDPFFSMLTRSLKTFMNALTASDWTMYPFATQNKKDFYNLMEVYLDAAFFPRLDRLSFKQEGHRLEFETTGPGEPERLVYKGVVYNEMKGAMSSPDQVMVRSMLNALYPDTTYGHNSGGDPARIPDLSWDQLKAFHRHHYHPSNAFFYTYGNLPVAAHLEFIQEKVLAHFDPIHPDTNVASQPRWDAPREKTYYYPFDETDDPAKKSQVCLAWLTADIRDSLEVLSLTVLEQVLLGNSGSPLHQALLDSGLGSTLSDGTGYDTDNKDTMFACGLKDTDPADADAIEKIIFDTLQDLAENGIDKELVESAIHQIEFHRKEVSNTPYPYGIKLLLRMSGDWFHHGSPVSALEVDPLIKTLFDELDKGPFLENQIRKYFLDNPHRVRMLLLPDQNMAKAEAKREQDALAKIRQSLKPEDLDRIKTDAKALADLQEAKENLSCLPTLEIKDIPPKIQTMTETPGYDGTDALCYEQPTSGIFYLTTAFGLQALSSDLLPLVPFFCHSLPLIGTTRHSYHEIARLMDLYTGGMGLAISAGTRFADNQENECLPVMTFSAKCLSRNLIKMFALTDELLCENQFTDLKRLKQLLLEYRSNKEASVVANGHRYAISLASRSFNAAGVFNENWHGIHQVKMFKHLTEDLSNDRLAAIADDLARISGCLLKSNNMRAGLIGEADDIKAAIGQTENLKQHLGDGDNAGFGAPALDFSPVPVREGWSTSSAVSFVAQTFQTHPITHEHAPALAVISKILRSMFLHREIREKGGAYGGFALYQMDSGIFCFASYRDPHIANTLKVYGAASNFIVSGDYTEEDIKEAILQVCADIDHPDTPNTAAGKAFYRKLAGLSDDIRNAFKQNLLKLNRDKVLETARAYFGPAMPPASVAVISSNQALEDAQKKLGETPLELHRI